MSKQKKNGFTLVELLAVIVILAVILVIAVPSIMNVITESRKGALASSAKLIASSAETAYISNQTLGITDEIRCEDVSNYTAEDYKSCDIEFVDGKAQVALVGQGKFEGMAVCGGTKEEAEVIMKTRCKPTAVEKIESLSTASNMEGLITDGTTNNNIRYAGASPKNYIKFNNENWRIIGLFNVRTSSGKIEKLMKIVRNEQFSTAMAWDSSASSVNGGYGVNEWSQADLMTMLNTYYIGESDSLCRYCNDKNQETCLNDCSSSVTPIDTTYRNMIESVEWNTGAFEKNSNGILALSAYNSERGTAIGKICRSYYDSCNDNVTRTTTWTGKMGLIYPSDYGYASANEDCRNNIYNITGRSCANRNWLHNDTNYWTLSAVIDEFSPAKAWLVAKYGYIYIQYIYYNKVSVEGYAWENIGVRPALYLKSDVSITSGDGSSTSPYQISMV